MMDFDYTVITGKSLDNKGSLGRDDSTSKGAYFILMELIKKYNLKVTHLGRGLSTGAELEYADKETIKAALENKK